jgi:hypothetical protein
VVPYVLTRIPVPECAEENVFLKDNMSQQIADFEAASSDISGGGILSQVSPHPLPPLPSRAPVRVPVCVRVFLCLLACMSVVQQKAQPRPLKAKPLCRQLSKLRQPNSLR